MPIKSDRWIRRMALERGMIEPFVDGQVREEEGRRIVSYGLSSYGYDIRVADEFLVFRPEMQVRSLTDLQAAFLAGVLETRSWIGLLGGDPHRPAIFINTNNAAQAEKLRRLLGTGSIRQQEWTYEDEDGDEETEVRYSLGLTRPADVHYVLSRTLPYLQMKREHALRVLEVVRESGNVIVDPKRFSPHSFTRVQGKPYCIIPPNSFALARTVEYFRIPREILVLCVGKSTYARCGIIVNVTPLEPEWEGHLTLEISNTTPLPAKIYANEGIAQLVFLEADEVCEVSYADRGGKYQGQRGVVPPKV